MYAIVKSNLLILVFLDAEAIRSDVDLVHTSVVQQANGRGTVFHMVRGARTNALIARSRLWLERLGVNYSEALVQSVINCIRV